jgi:hypothetical protein
VVRKAIASIVRAGFGGSTVPTLRVRLLGLWVVLTLAWLVVAGVHWVPRIVEAVGDKPTVDRLTDFERVDANAIAATPDDPSDPSWKTLPLQERPNAVEAKTKRDEAAKIDADTGWDIEATLGDAAAWLLVPPLAALALGVGVVWALATKRPGAP